MKKLYLSAISALLLAGMVSCAGGGDQEAPASQSSAVETEAPAKGQSMINDGISSKNILQVAIGSEDHSTLVAAVQAAGIEDVLANNGPLTVFAPVNSAFDALPEGTVENLLKPENKIALSKVLTYHAAPGTYKGKALKDGMSLFLATGHYVTVKREGDDVLVDGAKILATVDASNGVIHVVDKVLLPPEK